jgi:hypothetical protein
MAAPKPCPAARGAQESAPCIAGRNKTRSNRDFNVKPTIDRVGTGLPACPRGTLYLMCFHLPATYPTNAERKQRRRKMAAPKPCPAARGAQESAPYIAGRNKTRSNRDFNVKPTIDRVGTGLPTCPRGTPKIQRQTSRRRGTSRENGCTSQKTTTIKPHSTAAGRSGDLPLHGIQQQTAVEQAFSRKSAVSYTNPSTQIRKLLPPKIDEFFKSTSPIFAKIPATPQNGEKKST